MLKCFSIRSNGSATATEASRANQVLLDYLARLVELRMAKPEDDLISKLVIDQVHTYFMDSNMLNVLTQTSNRSSQEFSAKTVLSKWPSCSLWRGTQQWST
jgi:hypothetical protein